MSGGRYGHLYSVGRPAVQPEDVERMAARLDQLGFPRAASLTRSFIREPTRELRDLWRAVEFADSGDATLEPAREAHKRWEVSVAADRD